MGSDAEDFSASATLISFDHPIPLLRGPFPASPSDDPSNGPFVLAFRDDRSWLSAFRATESKVIEQCQLCTLDKKILNAGSWNGPDSGCVSHLTGRSTCWVFNKCICQMQTPVVENPVWGFRNRFHS